MLNYPGSWSDGDLAKQLYLLLDELPQGMAIATDSAFSRGDMAGKIVRPLKCDELERYSSSISVKAFIAVVKRHRLALSIRQAAEWGMGSIQKICGRLRHRLSARAGVRRQLLELCSHYYNYSTRTVGLNQIRTVYSQEHTSVILSKRVSYYYQLRSKQVY